MSTKIIYVVMGHTGEYSDRTEWPVHAHKTDAAAAEEIAQLIAKAKELGVHSSNCQSMLSYHKFAGVLGADHIDYNGVDWFVMPVELLK